MKNSILYKSLIILVLLVFASTLTYAQIEQNQSVIDRIMKRGKIVVGMTGTQPPLSVKTKEGELIGYEVQLANILAKALEVELEIKEMPFAKLLPSVKNRQIDIAMSGIAITTTRNTEVAFFGPYLIGGKSLLTKSAILSTITKPEELNSSRYIFTTLKGSTGEKFIKDYAPEARVITADNYDSAVKLIRENKADAMLADYAVCAYNYIKFSGQGFFMLKNPLTIEPVGVAISPSDPHFMNVIENFFNTLELSGNLKRMEAYWFQSGEWVSQVEE